MGIIFKKTAIALILFATMVVLYFASAPSSSAQDSIVWGVDFSQSQATYLGLDWKATYLAVIHDLKVKNIKLHTNWNAIETSAGTYDFSDTDWQVAEAERNHVHLIYVVGMKTGRWPECHVPNWAQDQSQAADERDVLAYISETVNRYKNSPAIEYWQVENEPFIHFGSCPSWYYSDDHFLKAEVDTAKTLDPSHKVIISDSGELSSWMGAAKIGDIVGITMYRNAWKPGLSTYGINPYAFLDPGVYRDKAALIHKIFGKSVMCVELQAEPWAAEPLADAPLSEQAKSMNAAMFEENISFAKATGLNEFYFWGVEWWYWMKVKEHQPQIWNEAKKLFSDDTPKT